VTSPPGTPPPDLLVSGEDRPPREWSAGQRRAAALTAVVAVVAAGAVGAGVLVRQDRAADERRRLAAAERDVVRLSLLQPGQDGGPRYGPRPPGVQLVVANAGPATVRLLWGTLVPGAWQVEVPRDRELRPGRSMVLDLRPPRACGTPEPRELRVEALPPSGRPATAVFGLAGAQLAYGGSLADALAAAALDCDPTAPRGSDGRTYPHRSEVVRPSR
jgi:hypothetical protein